MDVLPYLQGIGNYHESEAIAGALPKDQNSPQKVPFGLYAEQINGSAFTSQRHQNLHSWLYRIFPSVLHHAFEKYAHATWITDDATETPPTQMRWNAISYQENQHFIDSIFTMANSATTASIPAGAAIHLYAATKSMQHEFFYNADAEMLIVPQEGGLRLNTEFGALEVWPQEIVVIPRGIKFQVILLQQKARGYICENFGLPFRLPELGFIGANGLANPRHFQIPKANFVDESGEFQLLCKFQHRLWHTQISHSPLNVVAWHGNYTPYKYDLTLFNTINSVSFDHPDPAIFTVLTSPSVYANIANVDFVIFPPRWIVANNTFRPPYFHRNVMSEYMGLIHGVYDAKPNGFVPGGSSLHNAMSAHGPDADAYHQAIHAPLTPHYYDNTLAFMFESQHIFRITKAALHAAFRQENYLSCWQSLAKHFNPVETVK